MVATIAHGIGDAVRLFLFPALMALAASKDLLTMRISNRIPVILCAGFCAVAICGEMRLIDIGDHLAAGFAVLVVCFMCFGRGWMGGGDAKLAATTALWLGWAPLYEYVVAAALIGGAMTLLLLEFRRRLLPPVLARQAWVQRLHEPDGGVPYGIALAAAALIVYPSTPWMNGAGI